MARGASGLPAGRGRGQDSVNVLAHSGTMFTGRVFWLAESVAGVGGVRLCGRANCGAGSIPGRERGDKAWLGTGFPEWSEVGVGGNDAAHLDSIVPRCAVAF